MVPQQTHGTLVYLFPGVLGTGHGVSDGPRIDEDGVIVAALHRAVAEEVNRLREGKR